MVTQRACHLQHGVAAFLQALLEVHPTCIAQLRSMRLVPVLLGPSFYLFGMQEEALPPLTPSVCSTPGRRSTPGELATNQGLPRAFSGLGRAFSGTARSASASMRSAAVVDEDGGRIEEEDEDDGLIGELLIPVLEERGVAVQSGFVPVPSSRSSVGLLSQWQEAGGMAASSPLSQLSASLHLAGGVAISDVGTAYNLLCCYRILFLLMYWSTRNLFIFTTQK